MSFDRLAPHYTWMERVLAGRRLQRTRTAWLDELAARCRDRQPGAARWLIAGVGHGHFLQACANRFPAAEIASVDASAGMLARARARALPTVPNPDRLEFVHAALPNWQPPAGAFDVIVTHFFLDCFPPRELVQVVAGLARAARPRAYWVLSDFTVPAQGWGRQRARVIHWMMYAFFRRVTQVRARRVTVPDPLLRAHGFSLAGRRTFEWGLLHSDLWERKMEHG
ncbi:class I SAM-dependent methyltransferase [Opitutus terrae]|uniref:Methyltransferase type 12 n=1 Tax=Opitutus terrae (strain DSM 11246 / JCM 15787 / PB90-1) TaxID=452637 RepID=B1ZXR2_OPITP|nr:class I SAM-dependent methyltransferase [Opitutus terrae]ACB74284.1 Methyltransferase type 12 [Opitutus terrae PB90-1]